MLIRRPADIRSCEITPEFACLRRRDLLAGAAAIGISGLTPDVGTARNSAGNIGRKLVGKPSAVSTNETPSRFRDVTSYNNFVEFGTRKTDPAYFANAMTTKPWHLTIDGLVNRPGRFALEDIVKPASLEERIYRLRCVEAWSMVIPWIGFALKDVIDRAEPMGSARYVAFETLHRPSEMRGQRKSRPVIPWPYREGLRLDEAMHPLTILAVGMYGRELPNQNGAPLRLVVPWKYGFKSIKSIVRVRLLAQKPATSWQMERPEAYGFYANVNPTVDHPDWSQETERRIGGGTTRFGRRRPTLLFNGYGEQVADLYKNLDLRRNY